MQKSPLKEPPIVQGEDPPQVLDGHASTRDPSKIVTHNSRTADTLELRDEEPIEDALGAVVRNAGPQAASQPGASSPQRSKPTVRKLADVIRWPFWFLARAWNLACLVLLLAIVAAVPVMQLASLGYLLTCAGRLADGQTWRNSIPGTRLAGRIGTFALLCFLTWLPVWLIADLSYSAQLLRPGTFAAGGWRVAAFIVTGLWLTHVSWAAIRGGRWWHLVWPAPLRFVTQIWRPATWSAASDALYDLVSSLQFPRLWWLGCRAAIGALLWIAIPVSLMIVGLRAYELEPAGLVGFIGAVMMTFVMMYLPFLQIQMARDNKFSGIVRLREIRRHFRYAPFAFALSLLGLCLLCIPLYLLRIEATPAELLWLPNVLFVAFMLPAKLFLGAAMGYANRRQSSGLKTRHWAMRWPARVLCLASALVYVGSLYVAQLIAWQGAPVMYFQHAFLVPAPLVSS